MYIELIPTALIIAVVGALAYGAYLVLFGKKTAFELLEPADRDALRRAVSLLARPSLGGRLANLIGSPVEAVGQSLPQDASQAIGVATTKSLEAAFKLALTTMRNDKRESSQLLHRALAVASGAAGGALGIFSLPVELPVSTLIMLRAILDIARSEGEDLHDPQAVLSCVAVLGLGARTEGGGGYYEQRKKLEGSVAEAAAFIGERAVVEEASPTLAQLLARLATPFGFVVTEKTAAQMIPVVGALGGAAINYAFVEHFQSVARGHFIVRRLERKYGEKAVAAAYGEALQDLKFDEDL